jgi:hypothetical protein
VPSRGEWNSNCCVCPSPAAASFLLSIHKKCQ